MATKKDNASIFTIVTGVIAVSLLIAGALVYLQSNAAAGRLPDALNNPWLPIVAIVVALLLVVTLHVLHSKVSVFERMAREQAE
jgi:hypothetical protein